MSFQIHFGLILVQGIGLLGFIRSPQSYQNFAKFFIHIVAEIRIFGQVLRDAIDIPPQGKERLGESRDFCSATDSRTRAMVMLMREVYFLVLGSELGCMMHEWLPHMVG